MPVPIDDLKKLCDYVDGLYIQKSGQDYINALAQVFSLDNLNDRPFTTEDIKRQPTLQDFDFFAREAIKDFQLICQLNIKPLTIDSTNHRTNERITAQFTNKTTEDIFKNEIGVAYILTCPIDNKEHIIKIGETTKTFRERLGSYNCGCVNNWRTASTTNIKMKQSMVTIRKPLNLYLFPCGKPKPIIWHGKCSVPFSSPMPKAVEDIMIKEFISQFKHKPLANIQADAASR